MALVKNTIFFFKVNQCLFCKRYLKARGVREFLVFHSFTFLHFSSCAFLIKCGKWVRRKNGYSQKIWLFSTFFFYLWNKNIFFTSLSNFPLWNTLPGCYQWGLKLGGEENGCMLVCLKLLDFKCCCYRTVCVQQVTRAWPLHPKNASYNSLHFLLSVPSKAISG